VFKRQTTGSVICTSCGTLVGVNDAVCYNCNRRNPGLWGFAPAFRRLGQDLGFVPLVMGGTIVLYVLSLLVDVAGMRPILAPSSMAIRLLGASGSYPVFVEGRWWTVLTAGWLHGGLLHIVLNMLWIRQLAPAVAELYGPGRMVIVYTLAGVVGFTFTSVAGRYIGYLPLIGGAQLSLGASAPIFGLLGALVYYGNRTGSRHVREAGLQYALMMGIFGLIMPGIDNQAHLGGFVGGYVAGLLLDPLKPERIDHLVGGAACLVITLVAVVASFVTALPLLLN
jgi:rhomboid protease GluP